MAGPVSRIPWETAALAFLGVLAAVCALATGLAAVLILAAGGMPLGMVLAACSWAMGCGAKACAGRVRWRKFGGDKPVLHPDEQLALNGYGDLEDLLAKTPRMEAPG